MLKSYRKKARIVAECELFQEERDGLEEGLWVLSKSGMKSFDALGSRKKTIAILRDRWWPQTAEQGGDKICKRFLCSVKKRNEYLVVGGVSLRSRNGARSRKEYAVNG